MELLQLERKRSSVNSEAIASHVLYGSHDRLAWLTYIWSRIENDAGFNKSHRPFLNHTERYIDACRKIKNFLIVVEEEELDTLEKIYDAYLAIDENLPIDVHMSMFIPTMEFHTSTEQKALWLEAARTFRIIGAYAQTELAHGSNVRGIETTATYQMETDEFIINSPTLTSAKWWPGGLAHTATHACVYCNLILEGKNYGPHPFMVQLRSLIDHSLYPGIETGDVGPKLGYDPVYLTLSTTITTKVISIDCYFHPHHHYHSHYHYHYYQIQFHGQRICPISSCTHTTLQHAHGLCTSIF